MGSVTFGVTQETIDAEINVITELAEIDPDCEAIPALVEDVEYHQFSLKVRERIWDCMNCPLHRTCIKPVALLGETRNASIIALGEAPGQTEDEEGIGFSGRSGMLLRASAKKAGVPIDDFVNTVCCRPPKNRTPEKKEMDACFSNLDAQIRHLNPWLILTFGKTPLWAAANNFRLRVTEHHGIFFTTRWPGIWGFSFFHPSYVLRSQTESKRVPQGDKNDYKIKEAELNCRKWGEDWEQLSRIVQLRKLFDAQFVESYSQDLTDFQQAVEKVMREDPAPYPKHAPVGWTEESGWGDDVDNIPF